MFFSALVLIFESMPAVAFITEPAFSTSYEPNLIAEVDGGTYDGIAAAQSAAGGTFVPPGWFNSDLLLGGEAAGRLPLITSSLQTLGDVAIAGTAFEVGWKIGRVIDTEWLHLEGTPSPPVINATVTAEGWCVEGQGFPNASPCGNGIGASIAPSVTTNRDLILNAYSSIGVTDCHAGGPWHSPDGIYYDPTKFVITGGTSTCERNIVTMLQNMAIATGAYPGALAGYAQGVCGSGYGEGLCQVAPVTGTACTAELNAWLVTRGDSSATYTGGSTCETVGLSEKGWLEAFAPTAVQKFTTQTAPAVHTTTMSPAPPVACSSACATAIRCKIDHTCSPFGASPASTDQFDCTVDPNDFTCPTGEGDHVNGGHQKSSTSNFVPFYMPTPLPGETLSQYIERLHALFWVGGITVASSPLESSALTGSAYAIAPDGTITRLTTTDTVTPTVSPYIADGSSPSGWPATMPQVATSTQSITIYTKPNPSVFDVAPIPPAGPGGAPAATIDLSPLTSLHTSCSSFPFGIFCYIEAVIGYFNVAPAAPGFHVDYSGSGPASLSNLSDVTPVSGADSLASRNFTLDAFSPYMSIVRDAESAALWIGAVWLIAHRFLNFGGSGDELMEASDDGSVI